MPTEIAMSPNSSKNRVVIDTTDGTKFVPKQARHAQMPVDIPEGKLAYGHGGRNVKSQEQAKRVPKSKRPPQPTQEK